MGSILSTWVRKECRVVVVAVSHVNWNSSDTQVAQGISGGRRPLLDVDEKVSFEYKFALLVSLRGFIGTVIFPAENGGAFDTVDVPDGVVACSHLAVIWFPFHNVDNAFEKICTAVLAIESS